VIDSSLYRLTSTEISSIDLLLANVGSDLSLGQMWSIMDQVWELCGCDNLNPNPELLDLFYNNPVWLLNGMFIEQDDESMAHRQAITRAVTALAPRHVVDFGGGFGTLARMLANAMPQAEVAICEPFPSRHGIESCSPFANIVFVQELTFQCCDVLVCTDVLEHVPDPLSLLAAMVYSVRPGGHLLIANCFYPVIACHLPSTFHLRFSFDAFCSAMGLELIGSCEGSHASIYRRSQVLELNWQILRAMEVRSHQLFPWREWRARHLGLWGRRLWVALGHPLHYPRKLFSAVSSSR